MPTKMMRMVEADLVTAVVIRLTLAGRVGIGREVDGAGVAARQVSVLCQQKNAFFFFSTFEQSNQLEHFESIN